MIEHYTLRSLCIIIILFYYPFVREPRSTAALRSCSTQPTIQFVRDDRHHRQVLKHLHYLSAGVNVVTSHMVRFKMEA